MKALTALFKREFQGYFITPLAYVFAVIFLVLAGVLTFYPGGFFERGQADLNTFFLWHPWLYLFLVPAIGMRLWSEERKSGTIELLLTMPVTVGQAVVAKYFAAWAVIAISLVMTFPVWLTVNIVGDPDNGVIIAAYLGSLLMAGSYLAIAAAISAITKNQVIAFVASVSVCFGFIFSSFPMVTDLIKGWMPVFLVEAISAMSFLTRFGAIQKGVIDIRDLIYFITLIAFWLIVNARIIDQKKAD